MEVSLNYYFYILFYNFYLIVKLFGFEHFSYFFLDATFMQIVRMPLMS